MNYIEIWRMIGQFIGLVFAAVICLTSYALAKDGEKGGADAKAAFLVKSLIFLPVFSAMAFLGWFLINTQPGRLLYWPNEKFLADHLGLFLNEKRLSILDGIVFFIDQTLGAILFDFFEVFRWKLSSLDYTHSYMPANIFIFIYRTTCSISVGALLMHVIRDKVGRKKKSS